MSRPSRSSAASGRNWRAASGGTVAASRTTRRVVLSLLGLALLGLLAWWLLRLMFVPGARLACLSVTEYDTGSVPPIPYGDEDVAAFRKLLAPGQEDVPALTTLQVSGSITDLGGALKQVLSDDPRDTLILLVGAHGISDDGTAYLLCSDCLSNEPQGRHAVGELLAQVSGASAGQKLLLLNTAHLPADPRLAMVVNEFPRLLREEVEALDDSDLWVLAAGGPFETSHVSHAQRRSVFGYYLTEGLRGAADADGNQVVDLAELVAYVRGGVDAWMTQHAHDAATQTCYLLRGGMGIAEADADVELLPVATSGEESGQEEVAKGGGSRDTEAATAARQEVRRLLGEAWERHDRVHRRYSGESQPIDYAPHIWREFQELLLAYERQYRVGPDSAMESLQRQLETKILPIQHLVGNGELPPEVERSTVVGRLAEARRCSFELQQGTDESPAMIAYPPRYVDAQHKKNFFLHKAPYYVRWHASASRVSELRLGRHAKILRMLDALAEVSDCLDTLEREAGANQYRSQAEAEARAAEALGGLIDRLYLHAGELSLDGDAVEVLDLYERGQTKGLGARIETLLCTPLLSAERRMQLLDVLEDLPQDLPQRPNDEPAGDFSPPSISRWRWERLRDQAVLEEALVRLADPEAELTLPRPPGEVGDVETHWAAYRQFGKQLRAAYRSWPQTVAERLRTDDPATVAGGERRLRLLDARDAGNEHQMPIDVCVRAARQIQFNIAPSVSLPADPQQEAIALQLGPTTPFDVTVETLGAVADRADVTLQYPAERIAVTTQQQQPIAPGQSVPVRLRPGQSVFRFLATAKQYAGTGATVSATLTITTVSGETDWREVTFRLPQRDVVELQILRRVDGGNIGEGNWLRRLPDGNFRLLPYPNRTIAYRLQLVNRFGVPKSVEVHLLAMPALGPGQKPSAATLLDGDGNLLPNLKPLAPPAVVELSEDTQPVAVKFAAKRAPATEAGAPAADAATPAEGEEEAKPKKDPISGLVCAVRELTDDPVGDRFQWFYGIDLRTLPPRRYVEPLVQYDAGSQRILIRIKAAADGSAKVLSEDLPQISPQSPMVIEWENIDRLGDVPAQPRGQLVAAGREAVLYAAVKAEPPSVVPVYLKVDGYPRAFRYRVRCEADPPPREYPLEGLSQIRLTAPADGHVQSVAEDGRARIGVRFEVDVPSDAFIDGNGSIRVGLKERDDRTALSLATSLCHYSPRQSVFTLEAPGPQGELKIHATVGDFQGELTTDRRNQDVLVVAQVLPADRADAADPVADYDLARVTLDGAAPKIGPIEVPRAAVLHGQPAVVAVQVTDPGGVAEVKIGFDFNQNGTFDGEEKPVAAARGDDGKWRGALPTENSPRRNCPVLVVAADRFKHGATRGGAMVTLRSPPNPLPGAAAPQLSTVSGVTLLSGKAVHEHIKVVLSGDNHTAETQPDRNGRFTFRNVPAGSYTITASGSPTNFTVKGSQSVTVPPSANVTIKLGF